jgi:hypothetical protein
VAACCMVGPAPGWVVLLTNQWLCGVWCVPTCCCACGYRHVCVVQEGEQPGLLMRYHLAACRSFYHPGTDPWSDPSLLPLLLLLQMHARRRRQPRRCTGSCVELRGAAGCGSNANR